MNPIKYVPELRVFPNSTLLEHKTEGARKTYIIKDLGNERFLRGEKGTYWLRSLRPTNRISPGTVALFRFKDDIIGEGIIKSASVEHYFKDGDDEYEGYIMFDSGSLVAYKRKITVEEINFLIAPLRKTLGKRNAWTRIPLSFHDAILALQRGDG